MAILETKMTSKGMVTYVVDPKDPSVNAGGLQIEGNLTVSSILLATGKDNASGSLRVELSGSKDGVPADKAEEIKKNAVAKEGDEQKYHTVIVDFKTNLLEANKSLHVLSSSLVFVKSETTGSGTIETELTTSLGRIMGASDGIPGESDVTFEGEVIAQGDNGSMQQSWLNSVKIPESDIALGKQINFFNEMDVGFVWLFPPTSGSFVYPLNARNAQAATSSNQIPAGTFLGQVTGLSDQAILDNLDNPVRTIFQVYGSTMGPSTLGTFWMIKNNDPQRTGFVLQGAGGISIPVPIAPNAGLTVTCVDASVPGGKWLVSAGSWFDQLMFFLMDGGSFMNGEGMNMGGGWPIRYK